MCIYVYMSWRNTGASSGRDALTCTWHPPLRMLQKCQQSQGWGSRGRHPRNCHRFWRFKVAILVTVVTFSLLCFRRVSQISTVTGIKVVLIAVLATVIPVEARYVQGNHRDQLGPYLIETSYETITLCKPC